MKKQVFPFLFFFGLTVNLQAQYQKLTEFEFDRFEHWLGRKQIKNKNERNNFVVSLYNKKYLFLHEPNSQINGLAKFYGILSKIAQKDTFDAKGHKAKSYLFYWEIFSTQDLEEFIERPCFVEVFRSKDSIRLVVQKPTMGIFGNEWHYLGKNKSDYDKLFENIDKSVYPFHLNLSSHYEDAPKGELLILPQKQETFTAEAIQFKSMVNGYWSEWTDWDKANFVALISTNNVALKMGNKTNNHKITGKFQDNGKDYGYKAISGDEEAHLLLYKDKENNGLYFLEITYPNQRVKVKLKK